MANRLPHVGISAMDCLTQGFNFIVSLNEFTYGFQSVSGFSIKKSVEYINEGGVNDHELMLGIPTDDRPTLTFRRGLLVHSSVSVSSMARMAAARLIGNNMGRKAALLAASSLDPQSALEDGPALGLIQVYNRKKELKALYSFFSLGTIEWESEPLDASDGSVLTETFTVAHTGLVRMPLALPSIVGAIKSLASDEETQKNAERAEAMSKAEEERRKKTEAANEASRKFLEDQQKARDSLNQAQEEEKQRKKDLQAQLALEQAQSNANSR